MTAENNPSDPGKSNPPQHADRGLQKGEWQILELLFDNPRPIVFRQIAASVQMPETHAHHYLDRLLERRLVRTEMSWQIAGPLGFDPVGYVLSPDARTMVVKRRNVP